MEKRFVIDNPRAIRGLSREEEFREEMRALIPEAVFEICKLLQTRSTPPSVKAKVIEMVLKYAINDMK